MNAFDVDWWIEITNRHSMTLDEKSKVLLLKLFELTEQLTPMGKDNRREFWLKAQRGSLEEFRDHVEDDLSDQEVLTWMQSEYPKEEYWYKFVSVHHNACRNGEFYGVFLNGKCVLTINDPNETGNPFDATELIAWLIEKTKDVIEKLHAGIYNKEIQNNLPNCHKYGVICRKDYWNIYPEERAEYRSHLPEYKIQQFLACKSEFYEQKVPAHCKSKLTARDFYEACAICYRSINMEIHTRFLFKDTKEEHIRYSGTTPKELYYMFADGRDDGLSNVPLDDTTAFEEWMRQKGPYYEFNGHHPWEILPSFSTEYSMHLYVRKAPAGYYFSLSGSTFQCSKDTVQSYLALRDAGLPVRLVDGEKMVARLEETDWIGIVPQGRPTVYVNQIMQYRIMDAVHLSDGDKSALVAEKAIWQSEAECRLL